MNCQPPPPPPHFTHYILNILINSSNCFVGFFHYLLSIELFFVLDPALCSVLITFSTWWWSCGPGHLSADITTLVIFAPSAPQGERISPHVSVGHDAAPRLTEQPARTSVALRPISPHCQAVVNRKKSSQSQKGVGGGGSSARLRQLQSNPPWPVSESAVSWMAWRCQRARQPQEMMTASSIAALLTRTIGLFGYSSANISTEVIFLNQVVQGGSGRR